MVNGPPMIATARPLMPTRPHTAGEIGMRRTDQRQRAGERLSQQCAKEQRGEEQPAAKAGPDRNRRPGAFQPQHQDHPAQRIPLLECDAKRTMAGGQYSGVTSARVPIASPPMAGRSQIGTPLLRNSSR